MSFDESEESELEAIRKRKLAEMQARAPDEEQVEKARQVDAQKQAILRKILTQEARQRLSNIRMVKPEFAEQIELQLIQLAQTGRVKIPLDDSQLKEVLKRLQGQRKNIKIRRI
ncbi:MAG: DNA-binding protein [Candidatus Bathyarchaeota archaeon]|nr:DNA-binding protein [Candidatus Bathyarchaeota archaeon]